MKFMKGVFIGTMLSAGIMMMYADGMTINTKSMMKKGKRWAKKMGM